MIKENAQTTFLNFGPQHPATHGTLHIEMELEGEKLVRMRPNMGYLHTGFEKISESLNYNQFVTVTDRMNYMSAMANNVGYSLAVEKLLGIDVPERCQAIRVIVAELARIADHIVCVGLAAMDMGAFSAFLYTFTGRETMYDLFEEICGARLTTSYTRVGGIAHDLPPNFDHKCRQALKKIKDTLEEVTALLDGNRIWHNRTVGVGVLSKENALKYSCSGPIARAAGVEFDLRKQTPYLGYEQYDFDLITRSDGDVFARFEVRLGEIAQSIRIIEQALDRLPAGDVNMSGKVSLPEKIALTDRDEVFESIEDLIHHFKLTMHGHGTETPATEVYVATEAPNGELGYHIVSDGSDVPYRVRVRSPSYLHYQMLPILCEGRLVADTVANLSSLSIIAGELDR